LLFPDGSWNLYAYIEKEPLSGARQYRCTVCGKLGNDKSNLRKHVENIHFPGTFTYTCRHCGETCNSRNQLNNHISRFHPGRNK
jgi:DNA-directed RNA polymerase subunit RPC12/RpoP